jgi:hypothetical protein
MRVLLEQSPLTSALAQLERRRNFERTDIPELVRRGGLRFEREQEERRIALAEDLIRRTDPGPFEDPVYLALLAYQAASIEMALPDNIDGKQVDWGWPRFLLGTIHSPELNAFSQRLASDDYSVVVLYSALIEFAYQAAKAVVAAVNPVKSADPRASVTGDLGEKHIAAQLDRNPEPVARLYQTLEAYFFSGYPRAFYNEAVPVEHMIPLTLLIDMAERWIIAHEYGHGFAARFNWQRAPEDAERAEEYFADDHATILTVLSAAKLDALQPEFALAGAAFALTCLEVFQRAFSVVRHGEVLRDLHDRTHPSNEMRAENILYAFDRFFEVGPQDPSTGVDLSFVVRPPEWKSVDTEDKRLRRNRVMRWPNVLFTIWDRVRPQLRKDFDKKRRLHSIWN